MKGRSHIPGRHGGNGQRSIQRGSESRNPRLRPAQSEGAGCLLSLILFLFFVIACTQKTTGVIPDSNTGTADTIAQKHVIRTKK